jgi:hypothetical protein
MERKLIAMLGQGVIRDFKVTGGDSINYWVHSYHCQTNCGAIAPNTDDIFVMLPRKASIISVTSFGPFKCSGGLPVLRAFDKSGNLLSQQTMQITEPEQCPIGDDDMANKLFGELTDAETRIDRIAVTPPGTWTWLVPNVPPELPPLEARAFIDYTVRILGPVAPPATPTDTCPPVGDPIWDSLSVRQKTLQVFDSSGAAFKPVWERREYLFTVHRNPDGSYRTEEPPQHRTQCGVSVLKLPQSFFPDSTLLAIVHVHPYEVDQQVLCPDGKLFTYNVERLNGLSAGTGGDWFMLHGQSIIHRVGMSPRAVGLYVIDKDRIWLNPPTDNPSQRFAATRYEQRRRPSCRWA